MPVAKKNLIIKFRIKILKRILLLLSIPVIAYSCKTTHNKQDALYFPRTGLVQKDTIQSDTVDPVFYNPVPVCDYGVLPVTPVYYEPYPISEYGVVPPDLELEKED